MQDAFAKADKTPTGARAALVFDRQPLIILAPASKPSVRQLDCPIIIEREAGIPGDLP
jgi:hypothetical protein